MSQPSSSQLLLFEPWPFEERVSPRARSIRVDVRHDGAVVLTIPRRVSRATAYAFFEKQRAWIERTRARLLARAGRQRAVPWDGTTDYAELRAIATAQARRLLD